MQHPFIGVSFDANILAGLGVGLTLFAIAWLVWFGTREPSTDDDDGPPGPHPGRG